MLAVISCSKIILRKETTVKKNDNGLGSLVRGGVIYNKNKEEEGKQQKYCGGGLKSRRSEKVELWRRKDWGGVSKILCFLLERVSFPSLSLIYTI